jgi:hypothetical protein
MKKEIINCDICKNEISKKSNEKKIQVLFETEQTEGRGCKPYLELVEIDLCQDCYNLVLSGRYIYASGAMGYNRYYFKNSPTK